MNESEVNREERLVEFERLNMLGRLVCLGGLAARFTTGAIHAAARRATDIYTDAEKAFKEGRDPNVEDARILDEE